MARLYSALKEEKISVESLKKVHAPIGLDIGAISPQEISVSILAELIAVKYGKGSAVSALRWQPEQTHQPAGAPV